MGYTVPAAQGRRLHPLPCDPWLLLSFLPLGIRSSQRPDGLGPSITSQGLPARSTEDLHPQTGSHGNDLPRRSLLHPSTREEEQLRDGFLMDGASEELQPLISAVFDVGLIRRAHPAR